MTTWTTKNWWLVLLACVWCASTVEAQRNDEAELLLREARHEELVNGNLPAAIQAYQRVVNEYQDNRQATAQALLRLGQSCEKLGQAGIAHARTHYDRLVRDYSEQGALVRTALKRLDALKSEGPASKLVWDDTPDWLFSGKPSPDSKYLSYFDLNQGGLWIRDLEGGEHRQLVKGWNFQNSVFSPNGRQLSYAAHIKNSFQLRVVDHDGSEPRTLYGDQEDCWIHPMAWSPDGKWIAVVITTKDENGNPDASEIALVSPEDRTLRTLKSPFSNSWHQWLSFSPDSAYLACTLSQDDPSSEKGDVFVLATDGSGREIPVVQHPADDYALGWTPDGKQLLFASDRTGSLYAYTIAIDNGHPRGDQNLVSHLRSGDTPIGFSNDGSYFYGRKLPGEDIYTVKLNPETGDVIGAPQKAIRQREGSQSAPDWSADGRSLACLVNLRSGELGMNGSGFLVQSENGQIRELAPKFKGQGMINFNFLRWSPDGASFLCGGGVNDGKRGLLRIDVQTGEVTTLREGRIFDAEWSPDGKAIYYKHAARNVKIPRLIRRDLDTGEETELCRASIGSLTISPNGNELAFRSRRSGKDTVEVVSTKGGEPRQVTTMEDISSGSLAWSHDGRHLLFVVGSRPSVLWRVPIDGGQPQQLGLTVDSPLRHLRVHPNGAQIAFNLSKTKSQVWKTENFAPRDAP